jgi:hypothetical protein
MLVNNPLLDNTKMYRFLHIANDDQLLRVYLLDFDNEGMSENFFNNVSGTTIIC